MSESRLAAIILILAFGASPVWAETYKWVDAKGVVNYSNKPPPSTASKQQVVEERVSVIAPDPSLGPAIAAMETRAARRAQYEEADFQRRQSYALSTQASYPGTNCPYRGDCGMGYDTPYDYYPYGYGGRVFIAGAVRRFPPVVMPHRASFPSGGRSLSHAGRGSSR